MAPKDFPIVGVGASAGGLEAYKTLLRLLPADTGAAFILIQHLDPNHQSMMADLLTRQTKMEVYQAENDMALAPNTVYVIPPGKFIRLIDHGLFLDDPVPQKGIRMSVDYFFRSMAETRGEKAIGLVLSGTGSDGTLGIREIKAAGGMVMVQKPEDADYDGMPRSAIASGAVDFVVPVAEMGERLAQFLRHPYLRKDRPDPGLAEEAPSGFNEILKMLRRQTDYDFRSYKKGTVERRIQRRMGLRQIKELPDYVEHMRQNPEEVHHLFRDLLIGVTRFFREPDAWEAFGTEVVDPLLARKPRGEIIRAWVPGCASGEEAYSLAILLTDRIDRQGGRHPVQIFATDLNDRAIEAARAGRYSTAIATDVPEPLLRKYFTEEDDTLRVNKRLRESVVFATQNVISDPPFSKLDLITCRNLMIYLEADVQARMIEVFHFALAEGGHLFLGNSENAERPGRLFVPVDKTNRIYRKSGAARRATGSFPIVPSGRRSTRPQGSEGQHPPYSTPVDVARRALMDRFVPASVLVDRSLEVLYYHGPVRHYLDFPEGEPTSQLTEIVVPALRTRLRSVLNTVLGGQARSDALAEGVPRNGHSVTVRISAESVGADDAGSGETILVWFQDEGDPRDEATERAARDAARAAATPEERDAVASLEYELQSTREDLQSTIEEMETANEELKASNEEVMSMNEELQSTNEELETSREELQSLNEELSTVNSQLEDKVDEVERSNNDLTNLLVSTDIGVIFLDTDLMIRRFTPAMKDILRIIDGDVGRPVEDIALRVEDRALIDDARRALDKLVEVEAEIAVQGAHLIRRVRPYRTSENRIEGVVVTYTDVSSLEAARGAARRRERQQAAVARLGREALAGATLSQVAERAVADLVDALGARFTKVLELEPDGRHLSLMAGRGWDRVTPETARVASERASQAGYTLDRAGPVVVEDFQRERRFHAPPILAEHGIRCGASVIIGPVDAPWGVLGAHESELGRCGFDTEDVNFLLSVASVLWLCVVRDRAIAEIDKERAQLRDMTDALPILFAAIGPDERFEFVNAAYKAWGRSVEDIEGTPISEAMTPDVHARAKPYIAAALAGEAQTFELSNRPFGEGEMRHSLVTLVPRRGAGGAVTGFYSASIDIGAQKQLESDLAERFEQYRVVGEAIPYGVWVTDAAGGLTFVSDSFLKLVGMSFDDAREFGWAESLLPETRKPTLKAWTETLASGEPWEHEHRFLAEDGSVTTILSLGRPIRDGSGKITSWAGLNLDITQRKREEERLALLTAELDHRVKNTLATVGTIARMSGRNAGSVEAYRRALEARIQAMAAAHRLLADGGWTGMEIGTLVRTELAPYLTATPDRIAIEGEEVTLAPDMVQTLALALHELTTNSVKHGALGREGGRLRVAWSAHRPANGAGGASVALAWNETGLRDVQTPDRAGFGTSLLTRVLAAQEGVEVAMDYREDGLRAAIRLPAANAAGATVSGDRK